MYPPEYLQSKLNQMYIDQRQREAEHSRLVREALGSAPHGRLFAGLRDRVAALWTRWETRRPEHITLTAHPAGNGKPA